MNALGAFMLVIGLGVLVFFLMAMMRNAKGSSPNPFTNILNALHLNVGGSGSGSARVQGNITGGYTQPITSGGASKQVQGQSRVRIGITPSKLNVGGSGAGSAGLPSGITAPVKLHPPKNTDPCASKSIWDRVMGNC